VTAVAYWGNGLCPSPRSVFLFLIGSKAHAGTRAESEPLHPAPYPDAGWSSAPPPGSRLIPILAGTMFQFRVADIRKLIERKRAELEQQGVCANSHGRRPSQKTGREPCSSSASAPGPLTFAS
jgi:hypothetical protein